jgi:transcriptional regulator of aromatic amino acid metabolism
MASVSMAFVGSDMDNKILDSILGAIPQPIIAIDASERILAVNSAAVSLVGHKAFATQLRDHLTSARVVGNDRGDIKR